MKLIIGMSLVSFSLLAGATTSIADVTATFDNGGTATVTNLGGGHFGVVLHRDASFTGTATAGGTTFTESSE